MSEEIKSQDTQVQEDKKLPGVEGDVSRETLDTNPQEIPDDKSQVQLPEPDC